jgi:hypothetical protein
VTLSLNSLGKNGRLGNQMFQYAALRGIAAHHSYDYSIPLKEIELYECFGISPKEETINQTQVTHRGFEFDFELFETCPDNVDLFGYFQTEKYFSHIENIIRQEFTFCDRIDKICSHYIQNKFPDQNIIALHIRRGDYLTDPNFYSLDLDYYWNALVSLPMYSVIVFSDDVKWVSKVFGEKRFTISQTHNQFLDLCLMSKCSHHIIANSSFSWWGAWLAKSKKVIAPKKWFAGDFSDWNTKDLYLPDWIVL